MRCASPFSGFQAVRRMFDRCSPDCESRSQCCWLIVMRQPRTPFEHGHILDLTYPEQLGAAPTVHPPNKLRELRELALEDVLGSAVELVF